MTRALILALTLAATGIGTSAPAQDLPAPVAARQGQMRLMALHLGTLGGMVRGNAEYDSEAASAAARNLVTLSTLDQRFLWPEGTSADEVEGSEALPAVWEDHDDFLAKWAAFGEGATAVDAVAGDGLDALRDGMASLGRSCGGCHDDYRMSDD